MMEIKNVLICGLGAVGMTFACKLQKYNPKCLKVLVDKERYERFKAMPPTMNGDEKFFDYILPDEQGYVADLVLIATKMDGLESALMNLRNFVGEDTIILPLINGVSAEERIAQVYGWERTFYGYFIGHSAMRVGHDVQQDGVGRIVFGTKMHEKDCVVARFFEQAGIDFENPQDIIYAKWLKFGLNVVSNQASCILKMTFGDMQKSPEFLVFARNILKEVVELAKCEGVVGWENLSDDVIKALFTMVENGRTSMWQDIDAGKKTELDIFAGTVLKLGAKHGVPTPYNQVFYEMIRVLEGKQ